MESNKQKDYLTNKLRKFLDMEIKDYEITSIYNDDIYLEHHFNYYFKVEDEDNNLLFRKKVYNRHARLNGIRYEDSVEIIHTFLKKIKPVNDFGEFLQKYNQNNRYVVEEEEGGGDRRNIKNAIKKYIPIFYSSN